MSNNLAPVIEELRSSFSQLAERLFPNAEMPMPVIHVPHKDSRRKGMSWYKPDAWKSSESEVLNILAGIGGKANDVQSLAEIAIAAEGLDRDLPDILGDLLHEMIHHYNFTRGKPDLGKSRHHTRNFAVAANSRGLYADDATNNTFQRFNINLYTPNPEYVAGGKVSRWIFHNDKLDDIFAELTLNREVFDLHRLTTTKVVRPGSKLLKYSCGCTNARVATMFKATCILCGDDFVGPL